MFNQTFYHGHLRKYVILFGTLFNNIYINRVGANNTHISTIKVPLTYAPKEKMLARVDADLNLNKPVSIVLPRMGFEMTSMVYSPTRKLSTTRKNTIKQNTTDSQKQDFVYNPVPYDINFSLYIAVKNTEDGTRILEQILPYFTPDWTATINLIPELDLKLDIPTVLVNVSSDDTYEGSFLERRALIWTLDFTMKGYVFGPVKKSEVITLANVNFYTSLDLDSDVEERVKIVPGQLANGQPTTNSQLTVDRSQINANSNYGYIVEYGPVDE